MADDGVQPARRFRGDTSLEFLDTLQPGERYQVDSVGNSPVRGQNSDYLSVYISHLAKDGNKFPLTVAHWRSMPFKFILNAKAEIKKVFDYPDELDDWIKTKLHDRWRSQKHFVKKEGFSKYTTRKERLAHRPKDVVESQWMELVKFWQNPKHQAKCAMYRANSSKLTSQQSTDARPHGKNTAQSATKPKRSHTAKEICDAMNKKRKKQIEGLESKPSQHSSESSSKKMKISAEASGSRGKKAVPKNTPVRRSERLNNPEHLLPLTRSNSIPASPVPMIHECVTDDGEDNMQAESDKSVEGFGTVKEPIEAARITSFAEPVEAMKATSSTEPVEAARTTYSAEPIEAVKTTSSVDLVDGAKLTSSASFAEPVEAATPTASSSFAARLTSISSPKDTSTRVSGGESDEELELVENFHTPKGYAVTIKAEPEESLEGFGAVESVEAAKTASSARCPTVDSKLVSTSSPTDISAPFVRSTSVSIPGSDEEFEFVDNFKIPKEYAVLYKKIFDKYGHMATRKIIKSNDDILVAFVSRLLKIISTMETMRGADLSESLLQTWEGDIEDVENLEFNIKWLRNKFDEVKKNWKSYVEIHNEELDATQVKYAGLLARKEELHQEISKVNIEIMEAEAKILSEKKTIQEKIVPENIFWDEPILGKLLS